MQWVIRTRAEAIRKKHITYFTGVPCKNGHIDIRYTRSSQCRSCNIASQHRRSHSNDVYVIWRIAKYRAKSRSIPFTITPADIIIPTHCPCCNVKLIPKSLRPDRMKSGAPDSPSLDRKVPALGYTPTNIAILCMRCNSLKAGITIEMIEFLLTYLPPST